MIPNYLEDVKTAKAKYPEAWAVAHHHGHPGAWDFIKLLANDLHAIDPRVGLNGKRGTDDLSMDALNVLDPEDGPGRTPDGRRCWVVDVIGAAGSPQAVPQWNPFTNQQDSSGKWFQPGTSPQPEPPPVKPYPGDHVFDAVGVALFADYAQAGNAPDPQMGRWFGRTIWDAIEGDETRTYTLEASIAKHRAEWRAALGLPPV